MKSSIFHNWTRNTRDDAIMATKGEYVKLSHEFAGIGGDASFYKAQSETVISRRITSNAVRNLFYPPFCGSPHLHFVSACLFQPGPESCGACCVPHISLIGSSWEDLRACACSGIIAWDLGMGVSDLVFILCCLVLELILSVFSGFSGWRIILGSRSELDLGFPQEVALAGEDPFVPQCRAARQH